MRIIAGIILILAIGAGVYISGIFSTPAKMAAAPKEKSVLEFTMKDIDGKDVKLSKYKGNVIMFVNTASKCGYTPQYEGLEKIYEKYKDKGFVILGFPANNFGAQEPGTESEIKEFCTLKYHDVVDSIAETATGPNDKPVEPVVMTRVYIEEQAA